MNTVYIYRRASQIGEALFFLREIRMVTIHNGSIVYTRGASDPYEYWQVVHQNAMGGAGIIAGASLFVSPPSQMSVGATLVAQGQAEMAKEIALIQSAGLDVNNTEDVKEFIKRFNEVLMGAEQFEKAVNRIKIATDKEHQGKENRAPTAASWFTSYLGTALVEEINLFINQKGSYDAIANENFSRWDAEIDKRIDRAIMKAWKRTFSLSEKEGKEHYGKAEDYKGLLDAANSFNNFSDYFIKLIRSKIDFSSLRNIFKQITLENGKQKGARTFIDSEKGLNLKSGIKSRSIGGTVQEWINALMNSLGAAVSSAASNGSMVLTSEIAKTDTVSFYSFDETISTEGIGETIVKQLDENLLGSESLNETAKRLESFYNNYLSKLNKGFIVYGNSKSYSLSESFKGFHNGGERKFSELPSFFAEAHADVTGDVENFIKKAYNTAAGAVFDGYAGEVKEETKMALMSAMASLLFDDWKTVGIQQSGGAQAIHVLQLEGVQLPLSAILIATGNALQGVEGNPEQFFKVHVNLPGAIEWPTVSPALSKDDVYANWEEQYKISENAATFSTSFLSNFKSIIQQWL